MHSIPHLHCFVGYRSALYAQKLAQDDGFTNALTGEGVLAWTYHMDYLVKRGPENGEEGMVKTNYVHTFGSQWDIASMKYVSVQFSFWNSLRAALAGIFKGW